jgi:NADH-quinone oxidoreductase subunit J
MEAFVFTFSAILILAGAFGVVLGRNPVRCALSLVMTLFGVAILFIAQQANFLAAVQVIVYAGAIVVLFLFVIMLLGVDKAEDLRTDPLVGQRWAGVLFGLLLGAGLLFVVLAGTVTGAPSQGAPAASDGSDVYHISRLLFTTYLYPFEITSVLLIIGVVGAVLLARRRPDQDIEIDADEPTDTFEDPADAELEEIHEAAEKEVAP